MIMEKNAMRQPFCKESSNLYSQTLGNSPIQVCLECVLFFFCTETVLTSYSLHSLQPFRAIPSWFMTLIPQLQYDPGEAMLLSFLKKSLRFHVGGAVMRKLDFSCLCMRGVLFWLVSYDKYRHDFTDKTCNPWLPDLIYEHWAKQFT